MNQQPYRRAVYADAAQEFATFDLGLAAALSSLGYILTAIRKDNPKKAEFVFAAKGDLPNVIQDFWDNRLQVDALSYWNSLKTLKNRLYSN